MHRSLTLLILLVLAFSAPGDELSDKQKQLQKVQNQLQNAQKKVKEAESRKKKADSEITRTASLKRRVDDNLNKLKKVEEVKKDSLDSIASRLENAETNLRAMDMLQNITVEMLLRADRSYTPTHIKHRDQRLLARIAEYNDLSLLSLRGFRSVLAQERQLRESDLGEVVTQVRVQATEANKMDKTISALRSESTKLSQQQKNLQAQITKLKKDASQLESLISRLTGSVKTSTPSTYKFTGKKISWPVRGKIIRSFGEESRAYGTSVSNNGIDIAVAEGTAVVAADDGVVVFADRYGGQGNLVIIDHKNGFFTVYAYNSSISVSMGAKVKKGQTIARSGTTGSASEPSLHFELRKDGKSINPIPYLD
ncbi:MAG TPA: peptidoglycan DD-metalloendopeptidase family protein [Candidatus Cloacimonadota bacterium]|nr:peptidoglycan DD-metalloendopeptidase family protein [Candidatus Cloacimonadota bacterium]